MGKLTGKVAVITGAGRGLGRAYALRLAALGAHIVINDIDLNAAREFEEELTADSVAAECEALGVSAISIEADVTHQVEVRSMVDHVMKTYGRLDILVNNAGGVLRPAANGNASTVTEDDWRFIMDVNLTATLFCCQAAAARQDRERVIAGGSSGQSVRQYRALLCSEGRHRRVHTRPRGRTGAIQYQRKLHCARTRAYVTGQQTV